MLVVINENKNLAFNLAAEEYMINSFTEEVFMLWRAKPSILIGKNQNAYSEINMDFVKENGINVVRRMSGGGAVYNDLGNTNYCFIMNNSSENFTDFKRFTMPIIEVLNSLGVNAVFTGKNDITIDGKKISGNAQYKVQNRMLHHGTLLFSSDIVELSQSLNPNPIKFSDKAVKSVYSRVTNIKDHLNDKNMDIIEFIKIIDEYIINNNSEVKLYNFNQRDIDEINKLVKNKYNTWEWNFGYSPKFSYKNLRKFSGGIIEVYLEIKNGFIQSIQFYGDFFGHKNIDEISEMLAGQKFSEDIVKKILVQVDIDEYFKNIKVEELINVIFNLKEK